MNTTEKGKLGEDAAVAYLEAQGYSILEKNFRASYAEIDIICRFESLLIFIEVKTRANRYFGNPEQFVSAKKREYIAFAASQYMEKHAYEGEIRFDIISIIMPHTSVKELNHITDAFFPGLA